MEQTLLKYSGHPVHLMVEPTPNAFGLANKEGKITCINGTGCTFYLNTNNLN